jgi:hypothetical protein
MYIATRLFLIMSKLYVLYAIEYTGKWRIHFNVADYFS